MRLHNRILFLLILVQLPLIALGQSENVPVDNPVYLFLKRMEARQIIDNYHDAVLPLSRNEVATKLKAVQKRETELTGAERGYLDNFLSEFRYDITGSAKGLTSLIAPDSTLTGWDLTSNREKFLYVLADSNVSLFANGLLKFDARRITGDALGNEHSEFIQFGGRFRGTALGHLGYYLQGTNAQFWGSRELLQRDSHISQAYTLSIMDAQNFDFGEGYLRYDARIAAVQVGRERLLWGLGFDQKIIASDNVPVYDFIRAEARYKSFQYTFMHAWLLGQSSSLHFMLPGDTTTVYNEPTNADKYVAAHRLEFSFPHCLDVGFQEVVIYSNRSPDLAYLNPLILLESAQRSRGERDNVFWAFDVETHFLPGLQLAGTILFDDLHLPEFFEPRWYNKYAYQGSILLTDPLFLPNTNLIVEYSRVEPYTFSHDRSREGSYSSLNSILGPRIGPNADAWFVRIDWLPTRNLSLSGRAGFERSGENEYDANGYLVKNVGGDIFQPHRPTDPVDRVFLDGMLMKRTTAELLVVFEMVNQVWAEGWYLLESDKNTSSGTSDVNHTYGVNLRLEL